MSKRKSSIQCGHRTAKRPAQRKQHLYLVLDDWEQGYNVRKVDIDTFDSDVDSYSNPWPTLFTESPVTRMEALHARFWSFVTHGTKIFAMEPTEASPAIPAFDIDTLGMAICLWPSSRGDYGRPLLTSVAGKLFLFLYPRIDYLGDPPPHNSKVSWSWTTINKPLPFRVISHVVAEPTSPPSWKLGKDTKSALHLDATLVYVGNNKFGHVDSLMHTDGRRA